MKVEEEKSLIQDENHHQAKEIYVLPKTQHEDVANGRIKWTRKDKFLLTLILFMMFADKVEEYLPGVITQQISCELGLTSTQEGMTTSVFYFCLTAGIISTLVLSKNVSLRAILMFSMYSSILVTVLCAAVANYASLLLSRALIGFCVGLNTTTGRVYFTHNASSEDIHGISMFLFCVAASIGGFSVAVEAWLFLEVIGWRVFLLLTSMPFFVIPLIILHCFLQDDKSSTKSDKKIEGESLIKSDKKMEGEGDEEVVVTNVNRKIAGFSLIEFIFSFLGYGGIILLPSLIRMNNQQDAGPTSSDIDPCASVVHGNQFLIIALANGVMLMIGLPVGYFLKGKLPFKVLQCSCAIIVVVSYSVLLIDKSVLATSLCIGAAKFAYSIQKVDLSTKAFDPQFFGIRDLERASTIAYGCGYLGIVIGTSLVSFSGTVVPVVTKLVLGVVEIVAIFLITEK